MAQRHVLMMLAAAATSFLEGESNRTDTGSAKVIGRDPDRRRTRADASIRKTGVEKTPVVAGEMKNSLSRMPADAGRRLPRNCQPTGDRS